MQRTYNWQAWGAVVLVVGFFSVGAIQHQITKPPLGLANGTFVSSCCPPISINNGKLTYKGVSHKLDLENMKFGLTGYLKDSLDAGADLTAEPTALNFSGTGRLLRFSTILDGREQTFIRAAEADAQLH